jgi:DNA-binding MarR family transcriptional regulator
MPIPNAPIINATKAAGGRRDEVRLVSVARVVGSASWVLTIPPNLQYAASATSGAGQQCSCMRGLFQNGLRWCPRKNARKEQPMGIADDAVQIRAQGWRTLAALHGLIEAALEKALQSGHDLSVVEFTVLDALSRQDGWHMRMSQLARAAALSGSAATRLVNRLEDRGLLTRILCQEDRRGIYTELTDAGRELLDAARPTHDEVLGSALAEAEQMPELAPLVTALHHLPAPAAERPRRVRASA